MFSSATWSVSLAPPENIHRAYTIYTVFLLQKRKIRPKPVKDQTENAEQNYFAQSILIRNHFVVLWFLWNEGTMGDFIQGNKYVNYSEWFFLSILLYFCVNFPVLNKYKNIEITLSNIWIWTAFGYVFGDFPSISLDSVYWFINFKHSTFERVWLWVGVPWISIFPDRFKIFNHDRSNFNRKKLTHSKFRRPPKIPRNVLQLNSFNIKKDLKNSPPKNFLSNNYEN